MFLIHQVPLRSIHSVCKVGILLHRNDGHEYRTLTASSAAHHLFAEVAVAISFSIAIRKSSSLACRDKGSHNPGYHSINLLAPGPVAEGHLQYMLSVLSMPQRVLARPTPHFLGGYSPEAFN